MKLTLPIAGTLKADGEPDLDDPIRVELSREIGDVGFSVLSYDYNAGAAEIETEEIRRHVLVQVYDSATMCECDPAAQALFNPDDPGNNGGVVIVGQEDAATYTARVASEEARLQELFGGKAPADIRRDVAGAGVFVDGRKAEGAI